MLVDLESIQHKLSSDYNLNICFSHRFPHIDGPSFSPCKPLYINVYFSKVGSMQFIFRNCTHTLTRTQREKFEDMFLIKMASKGTSLSFAFFKRVIFCKSHPTCDSRVFRISSYFNQLKIKVILEYGRKFSFISHFVEFLGGEETTVIFQEIQSVSTSYILKAPSVS